MLTIKRSLLMLLAVLLILSLSECGGNQVKLSAADNGSTIQLKTGQVLVIELEGNITTGYSWEVGSVDAALLALQGEVDYASEDTGLVGSGGVFTFRFEAKQAGETTLQLIYHRPFEEGV
jgi:inhibitor of cysteine peptidase